MNRKIIISICAIIIVLIVILIKNHQTNKIALKERSQSLNSTTLSQRQESLDQPSRQPASIKPINGQEPSSPKRQWVGAKEDFLKTGNIRMKNEPQKDWQEKLVKILKRGLKNDTTIEINHEKSLVIVNGLNATNTEQVVVIYNGSDGRNSHRAMIDSGSGKILRTWDHTIHENLRSPASLTAFPLQSDPED